MFRRITTLSAIAVLAFFVWLSVSPICYAAPPKKPRKTEQVEKKKPTLKKEKVKKAVAPQKQKRSEDTYKKLSDYRKKKAKGEQKRFPSRDEQRIKARLEKKSKSQEAYDYFRDQNGDGIDDRLKEKKTKQQATSEKKEKPSR